MLQQTAAQVLLNLGDNETWQAPRLLRALYELLPVLGKHLVEHGFFRAVTLMAAATAARWLTYMLCRGADHAYSSPEPCRALASALPPSIAGERVLMLLADPGDR